MSTVEAIENAARKLPLTEFHRWLSEFDAAVLDSQIESDAVAWKLDVLAEEALVEYRSGMAREL